jgi:diguanylate cyclase (GGDEF)-like protein
MSTQEAILLVILAAITVNLVIAVVLLVRPRFRARLTEPGELDDAEVARRTHLLASAARDANHVPPVGVLDERVRRMSIAPPADESAEPAVAAADPFGVEEIPTDPITGFDLPATWSKRLTEENARIQRYGHPATIAFFELPELDRLAERFGVEAAERLIPPLAKTMRRGARSSDCLARLGATRFAALLPDTDEVKAINYIERVRSACDVWLEAGAVALRLSIGWAEVNANQPVDVAAKAAERRLHEERQRHRAREEHDAEEEGDQDVAAAMRTAGAS